MDSGRVGRDRGSAYQYMRTSLCFAHPSTQTHNTINNMCTDTEDECEKIHFI